MKLLIPVEPHVHEFLTSPEMHGPGVLSVRKDSLIGLLIIMLATKGPTELSHYYHERLEPEAIPGARLLEVDTEFPLRVEFLNEENLLYVGNALSMIYELKAIFYTMGYMRRNGSERGGMFEFYRQFKMEDNPDKQEALRASSKRFRERVRRQQKMAK
ncbi:hypothetical protein [Persicitalea jodogahamensis]|uniref:Uncharacterized protein n=1 Tax=Persicitalea jodogahamensis TaxID=402147 RepID=A0A8J3D7D7_9BACT|nr:hypothetical protein [Persicitalea jodogahamensis]GHB63942.1 hypothetical protein GCM10007390_17250 [Persicitalea jodogahamensis]